LRGPKEETIVATKGKRAASHERPKALGKVPSGKPVSAAPADKPCQDYCALYPYQLWREADLTPSFNYEINFSLPAGKRLVIELVTASIEVPAGESARLRMFTGIGMTAGNFDLVLAAQGLAGGQAIWTATHSLRTYADSLLAFNINRDNAMTPGSALICVSGHLVDL
jgi:hypothetical protein